MLDLYRWRDWLARVPADCPVCGRRVAGQGLCGVCLQALRGVGPRRRCLRCDHPQASGVCPDCSEQDFAFDRIVSAFDYQGPGRTLIQAYKVHHRLDLTALLVRQLDHALDAAGPLERGWPDYVVPVPAHRSSLRRRGFSPAAEIARALARQRHLRYRLDGLVQLREAPKQARLGRRQRLRAQQGCYGVQPAAYRPGCRARPPYSLAGLRLAVVDDVLTTGATLHTLAQVLKEAGAAAVEGWVLARAVVAPSWASEVPA